MPQANPAEDIVETVLSRARRKGIISGFLKNAHGDRLDHEGIDFLIILNNGLAVPLQVKTYSDKERNEKKYREHVVKHPLVHFFITVNVHSGNPEAVYKYVERELRHQIRKALAKQAFRPAS